MKTLEYFAFVFNTTFGQKHKWTKVVLILKLNDVILIVFQVLEEIFFKVVKIP